VLHRRLRRWVHRRGSRQGKTPALAYAVPIADAAVRWREGVVMRVSQRSQTAPQGGIAARDGSGRHCGGDIEQPISASLPPHGSFGALVRAYRHRALLSQEQLAARAELSERTVRDLEADRVRSPRTDTVRLLADALQVTGPQRESWFAAARGLNHPRAGPMALRVGGPARVPGDAPAQLALTAWGSGMGNNRRCRRWPAAQFETETVAPGRREDQPAGQLAQDVDPDKTPVRVRANQPGPDAQVGNGRLTCADRRELAELRRENIRLREDVEILKRAAAIFATATG
jgi:transposase